MQVAARFLSARVRGWLSLLDVLLAGPSLSEPLHGAVGWRDASGLNSLGLTTCAGNCASRLVRNFVSPASVVYSSL